MKYQIVSSLAIASLLISGVPICWASTSSTSGVTYYVDVNHPQAEDRDDHGSIDRPWKTLGYAFRQLQPGDTLLIRGGTYNNQRIALREQNSGQENAPITVKAYPGEAVTLDRGETILFLNANWWAIEGLHFKRPQGDTLELGLHTGAGHSETAAARHITIRNCEFSDSEGSPIGVNYGYDISIEGNYFHDVRTGRPFSEYPHEISALTIPYIADNITIRNNRFEDVSSDGIHIAGQGWRRGSDIGAVEIRGNKFWVNRPYDGPLGNLAENGIDVKECRGPILIVNNVIHGFRPTTPEQDASGANGDGIVIHNEARNITIERNLFYDNTAHLNLAKGTGDGLFNIVIRNNVFRDAVGSRNRGYWLDGKALQVRSSRNIQVYHNTFFNNPYSLTTYKSSQCTFKNNVVIGGRVELGQDADWVADHNGWSQVDRVAPQGLQGVHDFRADKMMLDNNLRPLSGSPVIDAGQEVAAIDDFGGNPRFDGQPDLGAFEYISVQKFFPLITVSR
jgi:hypothetical protein